MLDHVYYIPKLRTNLISLGQLTEIGYWIVMDDDEIIVSEKNPHRLIMCVQRTGNRLYKIELNPVEPTCLLTSLGNDAWLWHGRLGHVNFQAMKKLVDKEMDGGVPFIQHPDQICQSCLAAKQTRIPFPHALHWRADEELKIVHIDLCGPISPATVGGNKYFMLVVDDCTRFTYVYMLKSKDQAVDAFVRYKAEAENASGNKLKMLRSDRGENFWQMLFKMCV